ncbi:hypothetical protein [Pseudoprimorskyibacter insulae]|nr:hypothetical protein [Pseudoprimorskyibacter insulae]
MSSFIASQDLAFLATSFLAALQVPVFGWVAYKDRLKPADRARRLLGVVMMFGAIFAFYLSRLAYPDAVLDPAFRIPCVIVLMTLGFLTTLRRGGNEWLLALPASWAIIHAAIIVPERPISAMVLITYALLAYVATNVHRWRVVWSHNHQH